MKNRLNRNMLSRPFKTGAAVGHNPPATPLFLEKFDTPVGYDLSGWTEVLAGGIIDEDYTGVVLDGTQSLRLVTATGATFFQRNVTAIGHIYLFFQWQNVVGAGLEKSIIEVQDNVSTMLGKVTYTPGGGFKAYAGSTTSGFMVNIPSVGVKYNCWMEYNKNDGLNRVCNFAFSTGIVRPTSGNNYVQSTGPTSAVDVSIVAVGVATSDFGADIEHIYDYILADDVQIGDNP